MKNTLRRRETIYFITLLAILIGFALITLFVKDNPFSALDEKVSKDVQFYHGPKVDRFMEGISYFGSYPGSVLMVLTAAVLFYIFKYRKEALFTILTGLSGIVIWLAKMLINRPRPTADLVLIIEKARFQSFPSGHVLFYTTFFGIVILMMNNRKDIPGLIRWLVIFSSLFMILAVPFSRVYLGAHWFTDVTAGFFAGLFCLGVLGYFYLFEKIRSLDKN